MAGRRRFATCSGVAWFQGHHLAVVNLSTGDIEHRLVIEGVVEELYDVVALPGVLRPMAIGFRSDEIRFLVRPTPG